MSTGSSATLPELNPVSGFRGFPTELTPRGIPCCIVRIFEECSTRLTLSVLTFTYHTPRNVSWVIFHVFGLCFAALSGVGKSWAWRNAFNPRLMVPSGGFVRVGGPFIQVYALLHRPPGSQTHGRCFRYHLK